MRFEIEQRFAELEKLVLAAQSKGLDELTISYLCKLGSVQVCGTIERCVEQIFTEKIGSMNPRIASFLKAHFRSGRNYDCEGIQQLMFRFDSEWGRTFGEFVEGNGFVKEGISSCYAVRNSIAHGGGQTLGPRALKRKHPVTTAWRSIQAA